MREAPTFDEWFEAKYGATFDRMYLRQGMDFTSSFVAEGDACIPRRDAEGYQATKLTEGPHGGWIRGLQDRCQLD